MDDSINQEMAKRFFEQMITLFVEPEIQRRKEAGDIPDSFVLNGVQIVFYPDGRKPYVRLNHEVRAIAKIKLKNGVIKRPGEPIYKHEVERLGQMTLADPEEADYGHATMVRIDGAAWTLSFDFVYNKALSKNHLERAEGFLKSAEQNLVIENWAPFVDNLYSACELIATSILLAMPDPKFRKKASHKSIHLRFNSFADLGNVKDESRVALNKLSGMRPSARYLKGGGLKITKEDAGSYLQIVREMKQYAESRISR